MEEGPLTKRKSSLFTGIGSGEAGPEGEDSDPDDDEAADEKMESFLAEIDDVDEEMALEMLAAFQKEQARSPEKRRTWKQNKDRKAAELPRARALASRMQETPPVQGGAGQGRGQRQRSGPSSLGAARSLDGRGRPLPDEGDGPRAPLLPVTAGFTSSRWIPGTPSST